MDKFEIRRQNLQALLNSHCGGRAATLADLIASSPSYVSRMLYPDGKKGKKRIGEDVRDRIEDAFSLKRGSLDELAGSADGAPRATPTEEASEPKLRAGAKADGNAEAAAETTLERLNRSEKAVLELYRRATDAGKTMIENTASVAPKAED